MTDWSQFPLASADKSDPWAEFPLASAGGADTKPPATWGDAIKREAGKAAQATDDIVRILANNLTFGGADRLAGYMGGEGKDAERGKSRAAENRAGWAGTAAGVLGMLAPAKAIATAGAGVGAVTGLGKYVAPVAGSAALGGTMGAIDAAGNDRNIPTGAALGTVGGIGGHMIGKAIGAGVNRAAQAVTGKGLPPTSDSLKSSAKELYGAAKEAGVIVKPTAVDRLARGIQTKLDDFAYEPELFPKVPAILRAIQRADGNNVSLEKLESFRKIAGNIAGSMDKGERKVGYALRDTIDDFVKGLKPNDTLAGDSQRAVGLLEYARKLWHTQAKDDAIVEAVKKAKSSTAQSGTGGNIDNRIRQQLGKVLERQRGLTPDETTALAQANRGDFVHNSLRLAGRLSPTTGGLQALLGVGATAANPNLAPVFAGGFASKIAADNISKANANYISQLIRSGGNAAALDKLQALPKAQRDAIIRALVGAGGVSSQPLVRPYLDPQANRSQP